MYKKKYLKYKTKYLDLQSQLGGNPNIIQKGSVWPFSTKSANPPYIAPTRKPTTESAIEILTKSNIIEAKKMSLAEYDKHKKTNKSRSIWSSEQDIVDIWNSVCKKINTGTIIDIVEDWNYKINIILDDGKIAIITMPFIYIIYNEETYYMDENTDEIKILTTASAIETLKKENMMISAIKMNTAEYEYKRKKTNKSRILWSLEKEIVDTWNSIYSKIDTGIITDVFHISIYKIKIKLDNENVAIIYMPDGFINYNEKTYYINTDTGQISILTIALVIEKLKEKNMMNPAEKMTMAEYNKKPNKSLIIWSSDQDIVNFWNSSYNKIKTGTIEGIFHNNKYHEIVIHLNDDKKTVISIPSGTIHYTEPIKRADGSIRSFRTSYFMHPNTKQIKKTVVLRASV